MKPLLEVHDLHYYYGNIHSVKGVSLYVNEGEIVTLIGANGAGKTTTLQTISGLTNPVGVHGEILFDGQPIQKKKGNKIVALGLMQVLEGRHVFPKLTVEENLFTGAYLRRDAKNIKEDLKNVYRQFPRLEERCRQLAGTLSGGEQQMLAMGRALMSHPELLMLDEPSMGLAPILVDQIFDIIKELHAAGTTILLVEQNANKALGVADRAYVLESGRVKLSGTGRELAESDEIRKAYLGG